MYIAGITCLCTFAIISQAVASNELPSCVKACNRNDPNLSKCWSSNFEKVLTCPKEFEKLGIPQIDPLLSQRKVDYSGLLFHLDVSNIEFNNTSNFKIVSSSVDLKINRISLTLQFNKLYHIFTIRMKGSVLNYRLNSDSNGCVEGHGNMKLLFTFNGVRKMKNGKEYISFNDVDIKSQTSNLHEELYNCVAGGTEIDKIVSALISKRQDFFIPMYDKFAVKTIGADIAGFITKVYERYPLHVLHPGNM